MRQFNLVGGGERTRGGAAADFIDDLERFIRDLTSQKDIGQPEAGVEVVRFELKDARELQRRLAEKALRRECLPEAKTNVRLIDRSIHGQQCVPGPIPAKFFLKRFYRFRRF